jgi:hypothetical protein
MPIPRNFRWLLVPFTASLMMAPLVSLNAAIVYSNIGSSYTQDFDSLPNSPENTSLQGTTPNVWIDDTDAPAAGTFSIFGWYLYHPASLAEGGSNGHQRVRIGAGTVNTGAFMSFGGSGSTERALGGLSSNTLVPIVGAEMYIALRLHNSTGQTLNSFTVSFNGEQWRDGGAATPNAQNLTFSWSTTATAVSDPSTSFTQVPTLTFQSPITLNTSNGGGVDGNNAGRITLGPETVNDINWAPDTDLWLRWADINDAGNDHGLAIDDFSFSAAIPEPSVLLLSLGAFAVLNSRRKRA